MADIFNKQSYKIETPFTADACMVKIDGKEAIFGVQVQCSYAQQIQRRRSIGNQNAVIYGSQPVGQISIGRLVVKDAYDILNGDTFKGCGQNGKVELVLKGNCPESAGEVTFKCTGCIASNFSISIEAEGLTVMDNITIEFLQMEKA